MKRRIFDFVVIFLLTLALAFAANKAMNLWLFKLAFPESIALDDVYWEDFALKLRPTEQIENRIVLVNVAAGGRREIAEQIFQINKYHPRVIGIGILFNCDGGIRDSINCPQLLDTLGNLMLANAIKDAGNVVMLSKLRQTKLSELDSSQERLDSVEYSDEQFMKFANHGFGNMVMWGEFRETNGSAPVPEVREMIPQVELNGKKESSFAAEIALLYDSAKALKFLDRNREKEWISFRGSVTSYRYNLGSVAASKPAYLHSINIDSLAKGLYSKSTFEDKIVLIGYLGDYLDDPAYQSRFYTPLNPTFAGRSMPDMLGITVYANIISMILNEDYINEFNGVFVFLITVLIISANIEFFVWLHRKQSLWYDSLCFIVPVFQIVLYSWLRLELLAGWNFRMDFEGLIYLIAFVSFAVNLFYGPILNSVNKLRIRITNS